MYCHKCHNEMLVEMLDDGRKRIKCIPCGISEIRDAEDRQLLTSDCDIPNDQILLG